MKINYKEDAEIIHDLEGIIAGENIFVMPELMKQVEGVLKVVADRAGREDFISKISVLPLPNLLYDLAHCGTGGMSAPQKNVSHPGSC